jgi:hypothetical protein
VLEAQPTPDADIRDFQSELRACTEGALTGSDDSQYSEAKFLQVRHIIERFRGREGQSELDRRWSAKVTDVRNWFMFAASERWRRTIASMSIIRTRVASLVAKRKNWLIPFWRRAWPISLGWNGAQYGPALSASWLSMKLLDGARMSRRNMGCDCLPSLICNF